MILRTTLIWRFIQDMLKKDSVTMRSQTLIAVLLASTTLTACTDWLPEAHKLDIQQGNTIKLEQVVSVGIPSQS